MKPEAVTSELDAPAGQASTLAVPPASARTQKADLLNQALQEYARRRRQGEAVDPDTYCQQFPSMQSSLFRALECEVYLEANLALLDLPAEPVWPEPGDTFLDYVLLDELGHGAFARVFLATEPKLGNRLVAVKISQHGGAEAEILGRISHPNIVPVYSAPEDNTTGFTAVVMPYSGSATLCDVLDRVKAEPQAPFRARVILEAAKDVPYPLEENAHSGVPEPILTKGTYVDGVRLIAARLADALAFIHARGIYHRDLKPSNVLLSPNGTPMLLDFNLSADIHEAIAPFAGTLPYMAPEQLQANDAPPDARSDLFSLGVILHELLTGQHPFGPIPLKLSTDELRKHLLERQRQGARPAQQLNPRVDPAFSQLIERCLALDPVQRPQTAAEVASALHRDLTPVGRTQRWVRRHPVRVLTAALACAVLAIAAVTAIAVRPSPSERRLTAGQESYQQRRYHEAVQHYTAALDADPALVPALFGRARAFQQLGATEKHHYNSAYADYQAAHKETADGRYQAAQGYCVSCLGRDREAAEHYRSALKAGYATAQVYNNLGYCCLKTNDRAEAQKCFDEAVRLDPRMQAAYHNRATLALQALANLALLEPPPAQPGANPIAPIDKKARDELVQRLEAGIADAHKAIELGPTSAELYFDAARLCAAAARADKKWLAPALQHLTEARKQGLDAKRIEEKLFALLEHLAAYQQLRKNDPEIRVGPPARRTIDPIQDPPA